MKYIQILTKTCTDDISSCCSDYGIAQFLYLIKKVLGLIQVIVPIILILMISISFLKMVINPDDQNKAKSKSLMNKFYAAIIVFFTPLIVNLIIGLVPDSFEIAGCWTAAENMVEVMDNNYDYESISSNPSRQSTKSIDSNDRGKSSKEKLEGTIAKKRKKVVKYAKQFEGNSYSYGGVWDGSKPYVPTDCSGFVQGIYNHFGYSLPRTSSAQAAAGKYEKITPTESNLKKGDLIFYSKGSSIGHVAIYIGDGKIIHASNSKPYPRGGIKISNYDYQSPAWARRIIS